MGLGRLTSKFNYSHRSAQTKQQVGQCVVGTLWCTNKPQVNTDSQDSPWPGLGKNHHLPPYNILCAWPQDLHSNVILSWNSQVGVSKFSKLDSHNFGAHNFVCKPLIEMSFQAKLQPLLRTFQQYVALHLHARKSGRFLTFSGLTLDPSFGYNLCLKCPNGSCKPILDIYVLRAFQ